MLILRRAFLAEAEVKAMKLVKYIPNVLTTLRLLSAVCLFFVEPLSDAFFIIYTFAGVSDVLDGLIARSAGCTSSLGARLDSMADLCFYAVMLWRILPIVWPIVDMWKWHFVGVIIFVRIISYSIVALKYKRFSAMHTYLNKVTGLVVFLIPYTIRQSFFSVFCVVVCVTAAAATFEELIIHIFSREYNPEQKTLLFKKK